MAGAMAAASWSPAQAAGAAAAEPESPLVFIAQTRDEGALLFSQDWLYVVESLNATMTPIGAATRGATGDNSLILPLQQVLAVSHTGSSQLSVAALEFDGGFRITAQPGYLSTGGTLTVSKLSITADGRVAGDVTLGDATVSERVQLGSVNAWHAALDVSACQAFGAAGACQASFLSRPGLMEMTISEAYVDAMLAGLGLSNGLRPVFDWAPQMGVLTLTPVPEPGTWATMLCGLAVVAGVQATRRRQAAQTRA